MIQDQNKKEPTTPKYNLEWWKEGRLQKIILDKESRSNCEQEKDKVKSSYPFGMLLIRKISPVFDFNRAKVLLGKTIKWDRGVWIDEYLVKRVGEITVSLLNNESGQIEVVNIYLFTGALDKFITITN